MNIVIKLRHYILIVVAIGFGINLVTDLWTFREYRRVSRVINQLDAGTDPGIEHRYGSPGSIQLAYANYLARREAFPEAEVVLSELIQVTPDLKGKAFYNLGNLYLHRAIAAVEASDLGQAGTFADLAKQFYRRSLQISPTEWVAKYNFEVAARLMPDFDQVNSGGEEPDRDTARKLWTRVPGFPRGLP